MQPINLSKDQIASSPSELVTIILAETDRQVADKEIADPEGKAEFAISSDALNYWRVAWRCAIEWGTKSLDEAIASEIKSGICSARGYELDDLDSAIQATKQRARLPFGWTVLDLTWKLSQLRPLRLLHPDLTGKRVPTAIAGIAYQLQQFQGTETILLPIDQLRELLEQRKIVVSGAVQRLVDAGVLEYADRTYHTGKAREFRFKGVEGEHFEFVNPSQTAK